MNITFDYYSISLLLGGFTALLSGIIVFLHNRHQLENIAWLALNISSAVWSFGYFVMVVSENKEVAVLSDLILHVAAICIPLFYFLTILAVTNTYERYKKHLFLFALFGLFLVLVNPTPYFVRDVFPKGPFNFVPDAGPLYIYFTIYFFALVIYALVIVSQQLKKTTDPIQRGRYWSVIIFTLAGFSGGGSVFFLTFNINIPPYPLILFSLYPVISGYAVFRYQLFDTKVITTQLITFGLWLFILVRTLLAETLREQLVNGGLLFVTVIFGILLIRSVLREVKTREKIEKLAEDLEQLNKKLESANERLKELDQLKSEFVSLATHQIRGPITAIKGYGSLILEGDYGEVPAHLKEPIDTIYQSSRSLAIIVDDFLNVSRIEQGRMKYDFTDFDLCALVNEVAAEMRPGIEKKGLELSVGLCLEPAKVRADRGKIKQVVGNLLDNAMKYTPKGSIRMSLDSDKTAGKVLLKIKDTGVGIRPETMPHLFQKFSRAEDASKVNILGTGLGLYVAREMVKANGGRVWAESQGEGKGSEFLVELRLV